MRPQRHVGGFCVAAAFTAIISGMVTYDSNVPWDPDDPRSPDLILDLSEYRHHNGRMYIKFAVSSREGILSTVDARSWAQCLQHMADQIDGLIPPVVPPSPRQTP